MANTVIQLKWSEVTATPTSLNVAEPAYSNTSNKLFIGLADNSVVAVGGKYYTDLVDAATSANTVSAIVKRDTAGGFNATYVRASLFGNANTATTLQNGRNFSIDGQDVQSSTVGFDGSSAVVLQGNLKTTGVTAGNYGGQTQIPTFTVDSKGRLSYAANVSVATSLAVGADSGTGSLNLLTDTLTIKGGDGIASVFVDANNTVIVDVDNTVLRGTGGGSQTINGNLAITGNLVVSGNTTTIDVATMNVTDPLIYLAADNYSSDIVDIGFVGNYYDGSTQRHAGFIRKHGTNNFYAFTNYEHEPDANIIDLNDASYVKANLVANFTGGNVSSLFSAIGVADGGTGRSTFTKGAILVGNVTGGLTELANTGTAGSYGSASNTLIVTTDAYGRVSAVTNSAIQIDASNLVSGKVAINRGGTNNDTYTTGAGLFFDGSKIATLANTGTAGVYGEASRTLTVTTDAYGRISSISNNAIAIDTGAIISGTLGVARGGTGAASFTTKGVIISNASSSTGAMSSLTSSTEGHVLQINSSGAPTFAHLNGGSF